VVTDLLNVSHNNLLITKTKTIKSIFTIISVQAGYRQYQAMSGAKFNAAGKKSNEFFTQRKKIVQR